MSNKMSHTLKVNNPLWVRFSVNVPAGYLLLLPVCKIQGLGLGYVMLGVGGCLRVALRRRIGFNGLPK